MIDEKTRREILRLFYIGKTAVIIAKELGQSLKAIKKILRAEREKIKNGNIEKPVKPIPKIPSTRFEQAGFPA